jgi:hypothetical protein
MRGRWANQKRRCYLCISRAVAWLLLSFCHNAHNIIRKLVLKLSYRVSLQDCPCVVRNWRLKLPTCTEIRSNHIMPDCLFGKWKNMDSSVCCSRPIRPTWHIVSSSCSMIYSVNCKARHSSMRTTSKRKWDKFWQKSQEIESIPSWTSGFPGQSDTLNCPERTHHNYHKRNLITWIFMKIPSSARTFGPPDIVIIEKRLKPFRLYFGIGMWLS